MSDELFFDTVINHFNRSGLKFTLDDIARNLRISKRTIYEQYGSKENVVSLSVDRYFSSLKEQEAAVIKDDSIDIIEKIRKVICLYPPLTIDFSRIDEIRTAYPEVYSKILTNFENNWENTFILFEEAFNRKKLRRFNLEPLKTILLGVFQEVIGYDGATQQQKILDCLNLILDGYLC